MKKLILYGAGNTGRKFIESSLYQELSSKYDEICFYDNDSKLPQMISRIHRKNRIEANYDILITSKFWREIYSECILDGQNVIGIYEPDCNEIMNYKNICIVKKGIYENDLMISFNDKKRSLSKKRIEVFRKGKKIWGNFGEITIMISNLCNYASIHSQCPASKIHNKEIMPARLVYKIIDELVHNNLAFPIACCYYT